MPGIHHVTAIAGNAAANMAFYRDTLGMRVIKTTINFDDPGTYHLYFGNEAGDPGTVLTFFPHEHAAKGRAGIGQAVETAFAIPSGSMDWWTQRLARLGVEHGEQEKRFGEMILPFQDHDGTDLALVAVAGVDMVPGFAQGDVPVAHAIRGIHAVTLWTQDMEPSAAVLTGPLGFVEKGMETAKAQGMRHRFTAPGQLIGSVVDLLVIESEMASRMGKGRMGAGSVHHIAFRASSYEEQARMAQVLKQNLRIGTTEQIDRNYFRSIYFREPSGVIFEIATDDPGFAIDEPLESLGQKLMLPVWLEERRSSIEARLPSLKTKNDEAVA